jgi:TFIIF-interacting CTD phosphatase-like protein
MIAQKKLSLILDLDHTLLHATVGAPLATLPQVENLVPFKLEDSAFQYFVKLRYVH